MKLLLGFLCIFAAAAHAADERHFELTYAAALKEMPPGAKVVDLWLPVAQDTDGQKVEAVKVAYPEGGNIATEPRYGIKIWHRRFEAPFDKDLRDGGLGAQIVFKVSRTEIVVAQAQAPVETPAPGAKFAIYLEENTLIPTKGEKIDPLARELQLDKLAPIPAARKVYDWLIDNFTYNFLLKGAGQGDTRWACDAKSGDCSDYASTFIALCRNRGIPADHEFGFPIRSKANEGRIPSYHCWARFYAEGVGWIPVDTSEADKHPELRAYNFGSQSADLIKFTHGRDVTLAPPQSGPPLNKFIHPYAEIDGKPIKEVPHTVSFKRLAK